MTPTLYLALRFHSGSANRVAFEVIAGHHARRGHGEHSRLIVGSQSVMHSRTKVRLEGIERIKHAFDALPPHHDDEVTKTQAIRMLIPHIETIRAKGYGLPAIVSLLSEHGVAITVSSLKTVLSPSRRETEGKKKRKTRRKLQPGPTESGDARGEARGAAQSTTGGDRPAAVAPPEGKAKGPSVRPKAARTEEPSPHESAIPRVHPPIGVVRCSRCRRVLSGRVRPSERSPERRRRRPRLPTYARAP